MSKTCLKLFVFSKVLTFLNICLLCWHILAKPSITHHRWLIVKLVRRVNCKLLPWPKWTTCFFG